MGCYHEKSILCCYVQGSGLALRSLRRWRP